MEIEMPTDVVCPLCRTSRVELRENKAGNPYFNCEVFNATVNLRPETDESQTLLGELREGEPEEFMPELDTLGQADDGEQTEETDGTSLEELL